MGSSHYPQERKDKTGNSDVFFCSTTSSEAQIIPKVNPAHPIAAIIALPGKQTF